MNRNKKSFLLHIDSLDILDELSNEEAGLLFKAIKDYQKCDEKALSGLLRIAFSPFKNQFVRDDERYDLTCKRRAEAGSIGGKQKVANASKCKQKVANVADNKNKNKNKNKNNNEYIKDMSAKDNVPHEIFDYWREVMGKSELSKFTSKRIKAVKSRLSDGYTTDQIKSAIKGCSMTPHNMGQNEQGKRFDCLELICRSGENIERFSGNTINSHAQNHSLITEQNINNIQEWVNE